ncbi:MAG: metallophosphatase family protein [Bacteroidetes bacterium]|nr:metallophosphatase family protein [Bacteroidota bacterium]
MEKKISRIDINSSKLLIFGGVYSNLQALEAVQEFARTNHFSKEEIICTGDIVAYCAQPEECVKSIVDWGIHSISGNVEIQLCTGSDDCGCNFNDGSRCDLFSRQWFPFAKENLSEQSIQWMSQLPEFLSFDFSGKRFAVIHGTVNETAGYIFESTPWKEKQAILDQLNAEVVLAGHCGLPFVSQNEGLAWLNAGVIGMPANDGTDRVWCMTLEESLESIKVQFHTLEYDTHEASARMRENKLPAEYAKTLLTGTWDSNEILPKQEAEAQGKRIDLEKTAFTIPKTFKEAAAN